MMVRNDMLSVGSMGPLVKELQTLLGVRADGVFGPGTKMALMDFQKREGLVADGMAGPKTWERLSKVSASKILPIFRIGDPEDFSDPEEALPVVDEPVEHAVTCEDSTALISLIMSANITRRVKRVMYHCTATSPNAKISSILDYWKNTLGWKNPGYHIIITSTGAWSQLLDFNGVSNGVRGHNSDSIHISYIGGIDGRGRPLDTRTEEQKRVLAASYQALSMKLPGVTFHGHYEFAGKACPSFNVQDWIRSITV